MKEAVVCYFQACAQGVSLAVLVKCLLVVKALSDNASGPNLKSDRKCIPREISCSQNQQFASREKVNKFEFATAD